MRWSIAVVALVVAGVAAGAPLLLASRSVGKTLAVAQSGDLRAAESFNGIKNRRARSVALFEEAGKVIESPRCLNCHPAGDRPTQTDAMRPHIPWVVRGPDGFGAESGLRCATCHHSANFDPAGVPGNPEWHLAPAEMAWQGKTLGQICAQIKDPKRNGGKDMKALIDHMANDELVGWAWHPGGKRKPAPGTQKEFGGLIRAWAATGAYCPS
ncbi:MAG: Isoquinoline 1-oxidoreductase subunit [Rhodopseudomonas sp.]|nr:Isoquinoline 1-oxidoreductase subunit [Rhodopseudomonas sp.]